MTGQSNEESRRDLQIQRSGRESRGNCHGWPAERKLRFVGSQSRELKALTASRAEGNTASAVCE